MNPCGTKLKLYPIVTIGKISQGESEKMHGDKWKHQNTVTVKQLWRVLRWLSRCHLSCQDWQTDFDSQKSLGERRKSIPFSGLYGLLHICSTHKLTHIHIDISFLNDDLWPFNNPLVQTEIQKWLNSCLILKSAESAWLLWTILSSSGICRMLQREHPLVL